MTDVIVDFREQRPVVMAEGTDLVASLLAKGSSELGGQIAAAQAEADRAADERAATETARQVAVDAAAEAGRVADTVRAEGDALRVAVGVVPRVGGWERATIDPDGRVVEGWHAVRGRVDATLDAASASVAALDGRVAALEGGGGGGTTPEPTETVPRIGGWETARVDPDGRISYGTHTRRGEVGTPPDTGPADPVDQLRDDVDALTLRVDAIEAGGGGSGGSDPLPAARRAARLAVLRSLAYRDLMPVLPIAEQPIVSRMAYVAGDTATQTVLLRNDSRLTYGHAKAIQKTGAFPAQELYIGSWVSAQDTEHYSPSWSVRFLTDSPYVELVTSYSTRITAIVDGKRLGPGHSVSTGTDYTTSRFDFGADVQTIRPLAQVPGANAGSGYVPGDLLTPVGGTGRPMVVAVVSVGSGGSVGAVRVVDWGAYTAVPGNGVATTTTGAGTGALINVTNALHGTVISGHTTRRMRRVELILSDTGTPSGSAIHSVRVVRHSLVRPWPFAGPRLVVLQDSYGQVFADRPDGVWPWRAAERLGIEDVWTNAIGGSGFLNGTASNGASRRYRTRIADLVGAQPADGRPCVVLVQGSINDSAAPSAADLQAEVEGFWRELAPQLPDAFLVQTGILRAPGNNTDAAKAQAVKDGFAAAMAAIDPQGRRSGFIDTRGTREVLTVGGRAGATTGTGSTDWWISGDAAHLTQSGHDYVGDTFAADLLGLIQTFSL